MFVFRKTRSNLYFHLMDKFILYSFLTEAMQFIYMVYGGIRKQRKMFISPLFETE